MTSTLTTREPDDKQLENVAEPLKQLGTDTMIIAKAAADEHRAPASQNICAHTIRDEWSGMPLAVPQASHSADENYNNLKFLAGVINEHARRSGQERRRQGANRSH